MRLPRLTRLVALLAGLALAPVPATGAAAAGPELSAAPERLRAALSCPDEIAHPGRDPVLLVHGTATDAYDSWSWGYLQALPKAGFDACAVDLPEHAMGDIQRASEWVVYAIRRMAERWGRGVDVIGHSQGNLEPRWAIRWWSDVGRAVDDYISLAGPHHGTVTVKAACSQGVCAPALWQMLPGSRFLDTLNRGDDTPGSTSYTSIYSATDELVVPFSTARLDGAANVRIQDVCPGRYVSHIAPLWDAAENALVLDALRHPGPARPARIARPGCLRVFMPGAELPQLHADILEHAFDHWTDYAASWNARHEPALAPYAR